MSKWKKVQIGELCDFVKGETGLAKAIQGKYPLVATGQERKSCNSYQFNTKAVCIPLVSSTGHGKKTLNYVHYQDGKFALGTILVAVIPNDEKILDAQFLHLYLSHFKDYLLVPLMRGAANVSLPIKEIKNIQIPLPTIKEQQKIIKTFNNIDLKQVDLSLEITHQQDLLKKLRKSILQEAIEGKLTVAWRKEQPDTEPASKLLKRIKAEKEKLIAEKKIKKEKPLPSITAEEIPFELPDGWSWCRLIDLSNTIHYGATKSAKPDQKSVRLLRITDIQNNMVDWENVPGCDYSEQDLAKYMLSENDILIARTGGTIGKSYLVKDIFVRSLFASYLIRVIPNDNLNALYIKLFIESPTYWKQLFEAAWGAGQPNVSGTKLKGLLVSLPPLAEQKAIVAKVENLFAFCDQLEEQINSSKENSNQLIQTVLKEAFAG